VLVSSPSPSSGVSESEGWWVPWVFTNLEGTEIRFSIPSGKTQAWPRPHNKNEMGPCQALSLHLSTIPVANVVCYGVLFFSWSQARLRTIKKN
jgi:hypothetical protein